LCRRLATIEAHCWAHVSASKVPRPEHVPLPDVLEFETASRSAHFKLFQAGHKLYKFRNGLRAGIGRNGARPPKPPSGPANRADQRGRRISGVHLRATSGKAMRRWEVLE